MVVPNQDRQYLREKQHTSTGETTYTYGGVDHHLREEVVHIHRENRIFIRSGIEYTALLNKLTACYASFLPDETNLKKHWLAIQGTMQQNE